MNRASAGWATAEAIAPRAPSTAMKRGVSDGGSTRYPSRKAGENTLENDPR
jgi:hypothetical protein